MQAGARLAGIARARAGDLAAQVAGDMFGEVDERGARVKPGAAIISLEGSFAAALVSDRYCGGIPARATSGRRFPLFLTQDPEPFGR
jgi:hypothetical protein